MAAGGGIAAVGRFVPAAAAGADPVLAGTAANLSVLAAAWVLRRFRRPGPVPA
jgi:hypothetical protein